VRIHRLAFAAALIAACLSVSLSLPSQLGSASERAQATRTLSAVGYSMQVPVGVPIRSTKSCGVLHGSAAIAGTYQQLFQCKLGVSDGTVILFGKGGPPFPPIPTTFVGEQRFHGVLVQLLLGIEPAIGQTPAISHLLALLPGLTTWIEVSAPGDSAQVLGEETQIVGSVRRTTGAGSGSSVDLTHQRFVGKWHVHDAQLDITSIRSAVISSRSPFNSATCTCEELDTLALTRSANVSRVQAVVSKVTQVDPVTGRAVPLPANTTANAMIGQRSFFEFIEPHLMVQIYIQTTANPPSAGSSGAGSPGVDSYGNAYWCGPGLRQQLINACGA
jgi:hypothetical protein